MTHAELLAQEPELTLEFELITAERYAAELPARIRDAAERVIFMAMSVNDDEATRPILGALLESAERGVETTFLPDAYSAHFNDGTSRWHFWQGGDWSETRQNLHNLRIFMRTFERAGGVTRFVHPYLRGDWPLQLNPYAGRNHIKAAVIDDWVETAGGVNASESAFTNYDYMLRFQNRRAADWLQVYFSELAEYGRSRNPDYFRELVLDSQNTLVINEGLPGKSVIHERVLEALDRPDVTAVKYLSQHRPGGPIEAKLAELQSALGPDAVSLKFNGQSHLKFPASLRRFTEKYHPDLVARETLPGHYIHSKLIIIYFKDGSALAKSGSDNLADQGVRYGTAEIALFTRDPRVLHQLEKFEAAAPVGDPSASSNPRHG